MKNHNYIKLDGLHIKLKYINKSELNKIKNDLTISPKNNIYNLNVTTTYELYTLTDNEIIVPRFYGTKHFGLPKHSYLHPESRQIEFIGDLRDYQHKIVNKCTSYLKTNNGGLLSIPCGRGKTVMALKISSFLKFKMVTIQAFFLQKLVEQDGILPYTNVSTTVLRI